MDSFESGLESRLRGIIARYGPEIALALGLALSLWLRFSLLRFESWDMQGAMRRWYETIASEGLLKAFREPFSNYAPLMVHLFSLATILPLPRVQAVKLVSLPFDFLLAYVVCRIVREHHDDTSRPAFAALAVLFAPTAVTIGALWGQSDAIYASMVLASLWSVLRRRYSAAILLFGVGISLKPMSVFFLPLLVLLWLRGEFPWWRFLWVPAIYLVTCFPSWIAGRPLLDLLMIYFRQPYKGRLSLHAPNWYEWIPDADRLFGLLRPAGWAVTAAVVLALVLALNRALQGKELRHGLLIEIALLFALVMPFLLPEMHERYFFLADLLSIAHAFYRPRHFWLPAVVGLASLFSFVPFLFGGIIIPLSHLALVFLGVILFVGYDLALEVRGGQGELVVS